MLVPVAFVCGAVGLHVYGTRDCTGFHYAGDAGQWLNLQLEHVLHGHALKGQLAQISIDEHVHLVLHRRHRQRDGQQCMGVDRTRSVQLTARLVAIFLHL